MFSLRLRGLLLVTALVLGSLLVLTRPLVPRATAADPTPLEVFQRHFRDRDARVRKKAVEQLAGATGPKIITALLDALADEDEGVRKKAASLLHRDRERADEASALAREGLSRRSRSRRPAAVRLHAVRALTRCGEHGIAPLTAALTDRQADVREVAAEGLASLRADEAVDDLHAALRDGEPLVRAAACAAIGRLRRSDASGMATAVLIGDRATEPRVAAAQILERYPDSTTIEHLGRALRSDAWALRVATARALGTFVREPVEARAAARLLVPALEREARRRVADEIAASLFQLTGIAFGPEPDRWTAWHADAGDTFEPPEKPVRRTAPARGTTREHLLDLPLRSEHVAFVLDLSHSMEDPIRFGVDTTKREALVKAFERAVNRLPKASWMNVIAFGTDPAPYKPELFRATSATRRNAIRFLATRVPDGRTNIWDSLELALSDRGTDTVVLVTDGAPSAGARRTKTAIIAGLRRLTRYRPVRVHTVEIGAANTGARWKGFLSEIAEVTGGAHLGR